MIENENQRLKKDYQLLKRKRIHYCESLHKISFNPNQLKEGSAKTLTYQIDELSAKNIQKSNLSITNNVSSDNNIKVSRKKLAPGYKILVIEKSSLRILDVGKAQLLKIQYKNLIKLVLLSSLNSNFNSSENLSQDKLLFIFSNDFSTNFFDFMSTLRLKINNTKINKLVDIIGKESSNTNKIYFGKTIDYLTHSNNSDLNVGIRSKNKKNSINESKFMHFFINYIFSM